MTETFDPPRRRRRVTPRRVLAVVVALALVVLAGGAAYFAIPQPDLPEARAALTSTDAVRFSRENDLFTFTPRASQPEVGLILYPGGKVDTAAYAPAASAIAARGYLVVIVPMPLNLAVLGIDRADGAIAAHPEIRSWAIGGHSLGGAMAAQYATGHPGTVEGLVLWASYSATDLSTQALRSLVVYGSLDRGAASFTSAENLERLPPDPTVVVIEGGNHEQMGWYTGQPNDPPATIAREEQQRQVVEATATFLGALPRP
jgi:hypothetical protein